MHILKAVKTRNGIKSSRVFECTHFTIDELPDYFKVEFPQEAEDGSHPMTILRLPDDYDAIYHMSPISGDTLDSWTWDDKEGRSRKVNHRG